LETLVAQGAPDGQERDSRGIPSPREEFVNRVLGRLERFDYAAVSRLLGDAVVGLGVRAFVHEVVLPLVHRVGARWADGELSIAEEHLVTGMLRNLLASLMQGRAAAGQPLVLATPAGERHEIGLLLVALLARDAGANVVYLSVDLPAADIVTAATRTQARVVGLSLVTSDNRVRAIAEIKAIHTALPAECELWLGGANARQVAAGVKTLRGLVLDTLQATEAELTRIGAGAIAYA